MISLRLPENIESKLSQISKYEHLTKTDVIKNALEQYLINYGKEISSFELGKDFFGKYKNGEADLSSTYKSRLKRKLNEKHSH